MFKVLEVIRDQKMQFSIKRVFHRYLKQQTFFEISGSNTDWVKLLQYKQSLLGKPACQSTCTADRQKKSKQKPPRRVEIEIESLG